MTQYLYLIRCQKCYKIGVANDVESRLSQLQTGNPYMLELIVAYAFDDASAIERALHQKFDSRRTRGEWFTDLGDENIVALCKICEMLGGSILDGAPSHVVGTQIQEAEEIQEAVLDGKQWDYAAMFADGWRIELTGKGKYWQWRERKHNGKTIYGGRVIDLPYPIDEMRNIYN